MKLHFEPNLDFQLQAVDFGMTIHGEDWKRLL